MPVLAKTTAEITVALSFPDADRVVLFFGFKICGKVVKRYLNLQEVCGGSSKAVILRAPTVVSQILVICISGTRSTMKKQDYRPTNTNLVSAVRHGRPPIEARSRARGEIDRRGSFAICGRPSRRNVLRWQHRCHRAAEPKTAIRCHHVDRDAFRMARPTAPAKLVYYPRLSLTMVAHGVG
jgi:hypothetical protein